jgi:hypothetical protein
MSAKSDEKRNETYSDGKLNQQHDSPVMYKRNKINTSEKLSKKGDFKTDEKYYENDVRRVSEEKISYYAESKTTEKRQRSATDSSLPSRNGTSSTIQNRDIVSEESLDEIDEVDREFENLLKRPNEGLMMMI